MSHRHFYAAQTSYHSVSNAALARDRDGRGPFTRAGSHGGGVGSMDVSQAQARPACCLLYSFLTLFSAALRIVTLGRFRV